MSAKIIPINIMIFMRRILSLLFTVLIFHSANSQERDVQNEQDSLFDKSSKTFLVVPLINNNPAMKTGFGAMGMYFFKVNSDDKLSPPSMASLVGLYSTNNSYIFVPMARLFWNENKNRATFITGTMRVNNNFDYDYNGTNLNLVFSELRYFVSAEYSRRIVGDLYLGALYLGTKTNYKFDKGTDEQNDFTEDFFKQNGITDNFVSSIGLNLSFDNRDYPYYPTKGFDISIRPKLNAEWLGSDNDYIDTDFALKYYHSITSNQILAISINGGFATGDVPFDGYQNYGIRNSLRGYTVGKYKGKNMVASQAEYRWNFYKRWGAVAFAGTGSIWGTDEEELGEETFERQWLPSVGAGLRFMVAPAKKINLRLDYAWGVDGNQGLYFGVMEAF